MAQPVPAAATPAVHVDSLEEPAALKPGQVCPYCGQTVRGPSALRKLARGVRVVLHDPAVDRTGKQLTGILIIRGLIAAGASDGIVQLVRQLAPAFGLHL